MSTGISCVFLNTCDKLQFTIVDTYLTFACAVCTFNANQYNSQCHRERWYTEVRLLIFRAQTQRNASPEMAVLFAKKSDEENVYTSN